MFSKMLRPLLSGIAFVLAAGSFAAPGLLIVPIRPMKHPYADTEGNLLELIADQLDKDGRVAPIAWTMTDPIFRSARDSKIVAEADLPSQEMAVQAASALRCEYIMYVSVWRNGPVIYAQARLVQKGKDLWVDPKPDWQLIEVARESAKNDPEKKPFDEETLTYRVLNVAVQERDGTFDTFRALANTWAEQMFADPLKSLNPRPRVQAQPIEGGVEKVPIPPPVEKANNKDLLTKVMALMAKGDRATAITTMRDAVDTSPLDPERRKVLVEVLMTAGYFEEAAKQARRAASILDKPTDMYVLAAKAWLAADKPAEAQNDLKEAVARDPLSPGVLELIGEVSLRDGKYADAIQHFTTALDKGADTRVLFYRSLAYALNGDGAKARTDLTKFSGSKDIESIEGLARYTSAIGMVSAAALKYGIEFRDLLPLIKAKPYEKSLGEDVDALRMRCDALQLFLKELNPPTRHQGSHGQRALGVKLILEASALIESYFKATDDDLMSEAQISLGEALRKLLEARDTFAKETSGT